MSRLRARCLQDAKALGEPAPVGHTQDLVIRGPPPSGAIGVGSSDGYDLFKILNVNSFMEVKVPNSAIGSLMGMGWSNTSDVSFTAFLHPNYVGLFRC